MADINMSKAVLETENENREGDETARPPPVPPPAGPHWGPHNDEYPRTGTPYGDLEFDAARIPYNVLTMRASGVSAEVPCRGEQNLTICTTAGDSSVQALQNRSPRQEFPPLKTFSLLHNASCVKFMQRAMQGGTTGGLIPHDPDFGGQESIPTTPTGGYTGSVFLSEDAHPTGANTPPGPHEPSQVRGNSAISHPENVNIPGICGPVLRADHPPGLRASPTPGGHNPGAPETHGGGSRPIHLLWLQHCAPACGLLCEPVHRPQFTVFVHIVFRPTHTWPVGPRGFQLLYLSLQCSQLLA